MHKLGSITVNQRCKSLNLPMAPASFGGGSYPPQCLSGMITLFPAGGTEQTVQVIGQITPVFGFPILLTQTQAASGPSLSSLNGQFATVCGQFGRLGSQPVLDVREVQAGAPTFGGQAGQPLPSPPAPPPVDNRLLITLLLLLLLGQIGNAQGGSSGFHPFQALGGLGGVGGLGGLGGLGHLGNLGNLGDLDGMLRTLQSNLGPILQSLTGYSDPSAHT